jgi:biopolymer transport protein ExbB
MANVKKALKRWRNGFRGLLFGSVLIWKFIMGNPSNFEGGNNEGTLNTLGQVYHGVQPVLLGMLLMVLVFLLKDFRYISGSW